MGCIKAKFPKRRAPPRGNLYRPLQKTKVSDLASNWPSYWPARGAASPTTSGGSSSSSGSGTIGNEYLSSNHRDRSMVRQRSLQKGIAAVGLAASNCLSQTGQSITSLLSSFRWDWQRDLTNQQASGRIGLKTNSQPATDHVPYGKIFRQESRFSTPFSP